MFLWSSYGLIRAVEFDDDTFEINVYLTTGITVTTQGEKEKWEAEKLLSGMGVPYEK